MVSIILHTHAYTHTHIYIHEGHVEYDVSASHVYVYILIYAYVYIYAYEEHVVYDFTHTHTHTRAHAHTHTHTHTHTYTHKGHVVYDGFASLAMKIKDFTPHASYTKPGEGGLSRMNLYLRDIMQNFETVFLFVCIYTVLFGTVFLFHTNGSFLYISFNTYRRHSRMRKNTHE